MAADGEDKTIDEQLALLNEYAGQALCVWRDASMKVVIKKIMGLVVNHQFPVDAACDILRYLCTHLESEIALVVGPMVNIRARYENTLLTIHFMQNPPAALRKHVEEEKKKLEAEASEKVREVMIGAFCYAGWQTKSPDDLWDKVKKWVIVKDKKKECEEMTRDIFEKVTEWYKTYTLSRT